jgi:cell division protein FtsI (penicillin-binding protein 3)
MVKRGSISYGMGLSVTPLQLAQAYATLANGGKRLPPTFLKGGAGKPVQAMSPKIAHEVMGMLENVTLPGGTAQKAAIIGYHVAGKTGTARTASGGGYSRKYVSVFAGIVPMDQPKFAMVVVINQPSSGAYYGGLVSAPVFHNVMEGALRLMDVPPDHVEQWYAAQAMPGAGSNAALAAPVAPASGTAAAVPADALPVAPEAEDDGNMMVQP